MPTTDELIEKADELGKLIAEHDATAKLKDAMGKLETDTTAKQAMEQYQAVLQALGRKQMSGQPIEVAEKKTLEQAEMAVVHNLTVKQFQLAQVEFADLIRKLDALIYAESPLNEANAPGAPGSGGAEPVGPGAGAPGGGLVY